MIAHISSETLGEAVDCLTSLGFKPCKSTVYIRMGERRASASIHRDTNGWRIVIVEPRNG